MSFQFKRFEVWDDACAMKVNTDAVLLGTWANVEQAQRILDIGTGSGVIALILAQRCPNAKVVGIDIDPLSVQQAKENVARSPFSSIVDVSEADFACFHDTPFTHIVCNPPYHTETLVSPNHRRSIARHTSANSLTFATLISKSYSLLTASGSLSLIVPETARVALSTLAIAEGFVLQRLTRVKTKANKPVKRLLMEWRKEAQGSMSLPLQVNQLTLMNDDGKRSASYQQLTQDFYLDT